MNIIFDSDTAVRLAVIELNEQISIADFVRQAVGVWSQLNADERRSAGIYAMQLVTMRGRS